jgi:uncharacterized Ntn-hydrolase superfamily protein
MIEYFYLFDYGDSSSSTTSDSHTISTLSTAKSCLIEHAKVFAMAVKYQAEGLRELAAVKFKAAASTHWEHKDLPSAITIVYTSTTDDVLELHQVVEDVLHDHFDALQGREELAEIVRSTTGLAYSLLVRRPRTDFSITGCGSTVVHWCRRCGRNAR